MAQTITVPFREYQAGSYEYELNTLPGNSSGAQFIMTRVNLPGTPQDIIAHIDIYTSLDHRTTWFHEMGMNIPGGILYDRDGNILTASQMMFTWQGIAGANGRVALKGTDVKVNAIVYQTFSTEITINSIAF